MLHTGRARSHREHVLADLGSSFRVWRSRLSRFPVNWHHHHDLELTWIRRGRGMRLVGDGVGAFGDDDVCLIGSDLAHTWYSTGRTSAPVEAWIVQFPPALIERLPAQPELRRLGALLQRARQGVAILGEARARAIEDLRALARMSAHSPRRLGQLLLLLGGIADRPRDCRTLSQSTPSAPPSALARRQIATAIGFLHAHWRQPLLQRQVARLCGQSPSAFAQAFRRWTGRTFSRYVAELRLGHVCHALADTDRPIRDIASHCGFGTLSGFNRRFRAHAGMTPRAYRAASRGLT